MDLEPGKIFAQRYRVERLLARGGMGSVYVAQQTATEALVALKVLDPRMLESESQCRAFTVEATVAARVRSHHIVRTLDAGFDTPTGLPYLVMELLEGEPLDELIDREGPLPATTVVQYVSQIAAGLDRAHAYSVDGKLKAIVHRDLKPSNLMLTHRDDGQAEIKILDFGIAKVLGQTTGVSREIKGTPSYMAFEQAAGEDVTPQTDIWALGLIAFYLLTGKSYWRSASSPEGTLESLLGEVLALPLLPATERMRALGMQPAWPTEAFDAWFARCVHRDPRARFESAGVAAQALRRALLEGRSPTPVWDESDGMAHTLVSEPPPQSAVVRAPSASRPRWPWVVGVGLLLVLLAGALLQLGRPAHDDAAVTDAASDVPKVASAPPATPAEPPAAAPPPAPAAAATPEPSAAKQQPHALGAGSRRPAARLAGARQPADNPGAMQASPRAPDSAPAPSPAVPEPAPDDLYNRR